MHPHTHHINKHIPVLKDAVLEHLAPLAQSNASCIIADATFGGGGHSRRILEQFPNSKILGCDQDLHALEKGALSLQNFVDAGRLKFFHGNFSQLPPNPWGGTYDGILADLGYSSNQLENPEYGLSFSVEGPLDMRLSRPPCGPSAWDLLCSGTPQQLTQLFKVYGEIPQAHKVVHKIKTAIDSGTLQNSTRSLGEWMEQNFPFLGRRSTKNIHPATLVFQALRIAVNDEFRVLDQFLKRAILNLRAGGRLFVITFHSLEDRLVKQECAQHKDLFAVTRKPITANEQEVQENPRSRSAKLRVYERTKT